MVRVVGTALALALVAAVAFEAADDTKPPLTVEVRPDRHEYALSDQIRLDVVLRNNGDKPLTVFGQLGWGFGAGLVLSIVDEQGRRVEPESLDHDELPPSATTNEKDLVRLYPNHFLGVGRTDSVKELFVGRGKFRVVVEYLSPLAGAEAAGVWTSKHPPVRSKTVEVVVK